MWGEPAPEHQVLANGQMRKQTPFLKNISYSATMRGSVDTALGIEKHLSIDDDPSPLRADQPGDRVDDRRFAGSGPPEQCGQPPPAAKMGIELERGEAMLDVDFKHG